MIITLDADGVMYVNNDEEIHIKATASEVKDVNGAGDTFIAVFACYFDADNIGRSLDIANTAAGISVGQFGTYAVTRQDLQEVGNLPVSRQETSVGEDTMEEEGAL